MLNVEIRNDGVMIDGIVNCTEKDSKPIPSMNGGKFLEQIEEGVFQRALDKADNVLLLLNHDYNRQLSSTNEGMELWEDGVGLHCRALVTDSDVVEEAKNGTLTGFSFGFRCNQESREKIDKKGCKERRYVEDMDLFEVSILNHEKQPAYSGCCIEARGGEDVIIEQRNILNDDVKVYDYSEERESKSVEVEVKTTETTVDEETQEEVTIETEEKQTVTQTPEFDYSIYENTIKVIKSKYKGEL